MSVLVTCAAIGCMGPRSSAVTDASRAAATQPQAGTLAAMDRAANLEYEGQYAAAAREYLEASPRPAPNGEMLLRAADDLRLLGRTSEAQTLYRTGLARLERLTGVKPELDVLPGAVVNQVAASTGRPWLLAVAHDAYVSIVEPLSGREIRRLAGHGTTVASGSLDGTAILWDVISGRETLRLTSRQEGASDIAKAAGLQNISFSADGKILATGSNDATIVLWDAASGRRLNVLKGAVYGTFSPDGKSIATLPILEPPLKGTSPVDNTVRLWNVASGKQVQTYAGHGDRVLAIAFAPQGRLLATGSADRTVRVWDVATGREVHRLVGHSASVGSLAFSQDGSALASSSQDDTVRLWDVASGHQKHRFEYRDVVAFRPVTFSADDRFLIASSWFTPGQVWDYRTGRAVGRTSVGLHFDSPNCKILAVFSPENTIALWDVLADRGVRLHAEHARLWGAEDSLYSVAFSPEGKSLASGSLFDSVRLWDLSSSPSVRQLKGTDSLLSVAFSPDGTMLASGSQGGAVWLWDRASGQVRLRFMGPPGNVRSVAFSPDMKTLASASDDATVRLWDISSHGEVQRFDGHAEGVMSIAFSPDGRYLASGWSNAIRLWNTTTHGEVRAFEGHTETVTCVAFSPNGQMLATGAFDKTVRLWDVASGKELGRFMGHAGAVSAVAFSPDGLAVVSGSSDSTVLVWEVATGRQLRSLESPRVESVAFSPDGNVLATAGSNAISLWQPATGRLVATLRAVAKENTGFVIDASGHVDLLGKAATRYAVCRVGPVTLSFEACADRFVVPGLLASLLSREQTRTQR